MIYILSGNDIKKRSLFLEKILKDQDIIRIPQVEVSKDILKEYSLGVNLFGNSPMVVLENVISEKVVECNPKEIVSLQESKTVFVFLEDTLKTSDVKKYIKHASIENFEEKKVAQAPKINTFAIVDAFARRDKITTWILYRDAVDKGIEPEMVSGLLFWKVKTMIQNGTKLFSISELKNQSSQIVSLYHRSHKGECDFNIGLEQFILTALSK